MSGTVPYVRVTVHAIARFRERCGPMRARERLAGLVRTAIALGAPFDVDHGGAIHLWYWGVEFVLAPCRYRAGRLVLVTVIPGPEGYRP